QLAYVLEGDYSRIEQAMSYSALGAREKWQREDYRTSTIAEAVKYMANTQEGTSSIRSGITSVIKNTTNYRSNKNIMIQQDNLESIDTEKKGKRVLGGLEEEALDLARKVMETHANAKEYEAAFELARYLKRLPVNDPKLFMGIV